jgi:hypothetical protein
MALFELPKTRFAAEPHFPGTELSDPPPHRHFPGTDLSDSRPTRLFWPPKIAIPGRIDLLESPEMLFSAETLWPETTSPLVSRFKTLPDKVSTSRPTHADFVRIAVEHKDARQQRPTHTAVGQSCVGV